MLEILKALFIPFYKTKSFVINVKVIIKSLESD